MVKNNKSKNVIQNVNIRIGDTNKKKSKRRRKRTTKGKPMLQQKPAMGNYQYPAPIIISQPQAPTAPTPNNTTIIQPPSQPQQDNLLLMNSFVDKLSKSQNDFQVANFNNFKNDINNTITNNNNLLSNYVNQGNYGLATGILSSNNYIINNTNEKFNEFGNKINNLQEKINNNSSYFNPPKVEEIKTPEPIIVRDELEYTENPLLSNTKKLINKFENMNNSILNTPNNDYKTSKFETSNNDYSTPKFENIYKDIDYSTNLLFGEEPEEPSKPVKQPEPEPMKEEPEIIKQAEPEPEPEPAGFKWKCPLCDYGNNADKPSNLNTHIRQQHTSTNNLDGTKPYMNKRTGISGVYITKPKDYIDNLINQNNNEGKQRQNVYYASKRKV